MAILCPLLTHCMPPRNTTPPLSVGDAFHAFTIPNILNQAESSLSIPASGSKIYILNFVAIGCRSCFKDYTRLQALQKQYESRVQIILVTSETAALVDTFLKTNKIGRQLHLPIAASDSVLSSWFPHQYVSHTVWLQNGIVKGITDPQYVDENNIEILLMGRTPHWPVKQDAIEYNAAQPLLSFSNKTIGQKAAPPYYDFFSPHIPGLTSAFNRANDSVTASVKTTILNLPVIQSYLYAYNLPPDFPLSQVVLNVADTNRYIYNQSLSYKLNWEAENTWCYESVLPSSLTPAQQQQKLINDLDFYFGLHSCFKKIKAQCFALTTFENTDTKPLSTSGNSPEYISLSNLVWYINHHWYGIPAFNQTGITQKRYIPFNEQVFSSYQSLQPYLKQYGLQLSFIEKEVEMLSLSENQKQ